MNNNNNVFFLKKHKVYNTLCPKNSYNANPGRTKIINKSVIKLQKEKGKKKVIQQHTEKEKPTHKLKHRRFVIRTKKKTKKLQMEVYTTYKVNKISNIQIINFII